MDILPVGHGNLIQRGNLMTFTRDLLGDVFTPRRLKNIAMAHGSTLAFNHFLRVPVGCVPVPVIPPGPDVVFGIVGLGSGLTFPSRGADEWEVRNPPPPPRYGYTDAPWVSTSQPLAQELSFVSGASEAWATVPPLVTTRKNQELADTTAIIRYCSHGPVNAGVTILLTCAPTRDLLWRDSV